MQTNEYMDLGEDRYAGLKMAHAYKAPKTAKAILDRQCYYTIFDTAMEELGEKKLVKILNRPRYWRWASKLVEMHFEHLQPGNKATLLARVAKNGFAWNVLDLLNHNCVNRASRMPLIKRIAREPDLCQGFLRWDVAYLFEALSTAEKRVLGIK